MIVAIVDVADQSPSNAEALEERLPLTLNHFETGDVARPETAASRAQG